MRLVWSWFGFGFCNGRADAEVIKRRRDESDYCERDVQHAARGIVTFAGWWLCPCTCRGETGSIMGCERLEGTKAHERVYGRG